MRTQIKVNDSWVDGTPSVGEWYRRQVATLPNGDPIWQEERFITTDEQEVKAIAERQWRDSELLRTDSLIVLPDYPRHKTTEDFKAYRKLVADWDSNPNFPNSELRPVWSDKL